MTSSNLAPHPPKMTTTPAEQVPVSALRVPQGFKVELWASGAPGARMMAEGPNGTVFVGSRTIGRVYAITEQGGQRQVRTLAQQLNATLALSRRVEEVVGGSEGNDKGSAAERTA
jgi:glucose/arabinose dehydrogenase